jgi:hypothetical protein
MLATITPTNCTLKFRHMFTQRTVRVVATDSKRVRILDVATGTREWISDLDFKSVYKIAK